jgi:putative membrane protein
MEEDRTKGIPKTGNLENDKVTDLQQKIEDKIAEDESLGGETLSSELSRDRTHMSEHRTRMSEHRTDLSDTRTDLSFQRTALSYERTLMSWVRTAISLISFGFTIYKFFEEVYKGEVHTRLLSPRKVGMIMMLFGFIGLLFAQIQHNIAYKRLRAEYPQIQQSLSSVLSVLILLFGLILFLAALFRQ